MGVNNIKKGDIEGNLKRKSDPWIKGIKCQKYGFLTFFSKTIHKEFMMIVESNREQHMILISYLGKMLIQGLNVEY